MKTKTPRTQCNLKKLRQAKGLTQDELSSAAGINKAMPSLLESSRRMPPLPTALRLAAVLGCKIEDIWPNPYRVATRTITVRRVVEEG